MASEEVTLGEIRTSDEEGLNDAEDSLLFFNYSSDGSSCSPVRSPIFDKVIEDDSIDLADDPQIEEISEYDCTDEQVVEALKHLSKETGHTYCECRRGAISLASSKLYGTYPPLRMTAELTSYDSFQLHRNIENNIDELCNTEDFIDFVSKVSIEDELEYMSIASQVKPSMKINLFVGQPRHFHPSSFLDVQYHLLHCVLKSFFLCPDEGITIEWSDTIHYKTLELLGNRNTKMKFGEDGYLTAKNVNTIRACMLLTHGASILLRDRCSSLLTNVADILLINRKNIVVLQRDC